MGRWAQSARRGGGGVERIIEPPPPPTFTEVENVTYRAGDDTFRWKFTEPVTLTANVAQLEIDFGAGPIGPLTTVQEAANFLRCTYAVLGSAGLPWQFVSDPAPDLTPDVDPFLIPASGTTI